MEEIFSVDFTQNELTFIRQSLETITIHGRDAKFVAHLQTKIEYELSEINKMKQEEENKKLLELSQVISNDPPKSSSKK
jgi:predicted house-cleaning noncanonical NTP pyrophosphatase (MazG superfamily)